MRVGATKDSILARLEVIQRTEGATLVEMAIASSILILLTVGTSAFCVGLYAYHATADAARMGSRWAIVRGSTSCTNTPALSECDATAAQIQSYVAGLGFLNITSSDVTVNYLSTDGLQPVTFTSCSGCNEPANEVQVTVEYPVTIPFVSSQSLNISSTSTMVISQ